MSFNHGGTFVHITDIFAGVSNDLFVFFRLSGFCFASTFVSFSPSLEVMGFLNFLFPLPNWFGTNIFYSFTGFA